MKEKLIKAKSRLLDSMGKSRIPVVHNKKIINAADHVLTLSFIRYLIIGFTSFGMDFGIFYLLDHYSPITGLPANITSTLITAIFNFYMSNAWTFKAGKSEQARKLKRYIMLSVFNYVFNNFTFWLVSEQMGVNSLVTKVFITAAIVCWNFFLYKLWVFKTE